MIRMEPEPREAFEDLIAAMNAGEVRAASLDADGNWQVHAWVKKGLLLGFRLGHLSTFEGQFFDKHTYPLKPLDVDDGIRLVPGGSAVRTGAFLAPGVICMPPMYVNTGAYVDEDTMIDSHVLVGSCAQIGKRVHLSASSPGRGCFGAARCHAGHHLRMMRLWAEAAAFMRAVVFAKELYWRLVSF